METNLRVEDPLTGASPACQSTAQPNGWLENALFLVMPVGRTPRSDGDCRAGGSGDFPGCDKFGRVRPGGGGRSPRVGWGVRPSRAVQAHRSRRRGFGSQVAGDALEAVGPFCDLGGVVLVQCVEECAGYFSGRLGMDCGVKSPSRPTIFSDRFIPYVRLHGLPDADPCVRLIYLQALDSVWFSNGAEDSR